MDSKLKISAVVPETPEGPPNRRRSSRRSTMASTLATNLLLNQIAGTPQSQDSSKQQKTIISESPCSTPEILRQESKKNFHPVFAEKKKRESFDFQDLVPATQEVENLTPKTKVEAWLNCDTNRSSPLPKRRRRSSQVSNLSNYFIERKDEENEHIPYKPPSFQDYSSDSAKALLGKFEEEKSQVKRSKSLESASGNSEKNVRKTRSLDLREVLSEVVAFVEVRSKNENRSDVVIDLLLNLGAQIESKLGPKCTHVVFKEGSLATYNKAKKLGLPLVSVNWIDACKKANEKVSEELYPPMNQEKYDSPGLFPRLRKTKSLQPKSDEEFSKMIEAKAKRIMKKKLEESPVIEATPSPKIPRRRRSQILETLREYEEQEKSSPTTPGSPCSSEELNTPLLKRIAKRLFKANQDANTPVSKALGQLEISNDGISNDSADIKLVPSTKNSPIKRLSPVKDENSAISKRDLEQSPLQKLKSPAIAKKVTPASPLGRPKKANKVKKTSLEFSNQQRKITDFFGPPKRN